MKNPHILKQSDLDILRPLYIASAISPICLLKGSQISSGNVRVCMYECVEVSTVFITLSVASEIGELEHATAAIGKR